MPTRGLGPTPIGPEGIGPQQRGHISEPTLYGQDGPSTGSGAVPQVAAASCAFIKGGWPTQRADIGAEQTRRWSELP